MAVAKVLAVSLPIYAYCFLKTQQRFAKSFVVVMYDCERLAFTRFYAGTGVVVRNLHYGLLLLAFLTLILGAPVLTPIFLLVWVALGFGRARDIRKAIVQLVNLPAWGNPRFWFMSILIAAALIPFSIGANHLVMAGLASICPEEIAWLMAQQPNLGVAGVLILSILVVPVLEEFFFRGFIFKSLIATKGLRRAAILSAFIYGVLCFDVIGATVFGLGMSFLLIETESILFPILVNSLSGLLRVLFTGFFSAGEFSLTKEAAMDDLLDPTLLQVSVALIVISLPLMFLAWRHCRSGISRFWQLKT